MDTNQNSLIKLISKLDPKELTIYLMGRGWQHDGDLGKFASVWHRPRLENNYDAEVVVPLSLNLLDSPKRMFDAIASIADYEDRTLAETLKSITGYEADLISVRVVHKDVEGGSIPLNDGVSLNIHARDLLAAAALSTRSKQKHFSGPRSSETNAYLDSLRLGQTDVGSYIVNVLAPLRALTEEQTSIDAVPISSVVTAALTESLGALSRAVKLYANGSNPEVFDKTVEQGVSANMCDALLGLSGTESKRQFEITITPANSDATALEVKVFNFDAVSIKSLKAASDYFKDDYVIPGQTIWGYVKRLDRPKDDENGTVTIEAKLLGADKHIVIQLPSEAYLEAVTAHRAKEAVQCHGDIHVTPRKITLLNPTRFGVFRSGDLFTS